MDLTTSDECIAMGTCRPVALRIYRSQRIATTGLVLHFHGGAFTDGTLDDGAAFAGACVHAGALVVSVDYPLAPAHRFPEAVDCGYASLAWLARERRRLAGRGRAPLLVAGEEAGGNIAAAVAMIARDRAGPELAAQILVDPLLDPCVGTCSMRDAAAGRAGQCRYADGWQSYLRSPGDSDHPYAVPASSRRLAGLPAALVLAREGSPLRDEIQAYASRLSAARVRVETGVLAGAEDLRECLPRQVRPFLHSLMKTPLERTEP